MYGLELIVIIFATLAHALTSNSPSVNIVGVIIFWRVLMGVGIGGDYPLSSIITSEYVSQRAHNFVLSPIPIFQSFTWLTHPDLLQPSGEVP